MIGERSHLKIVGGPRAVARAFREARRKELIRTGRHWHRRYLPEHFTIAAEKRYGYQRRQVRTRRGRPGYTIMKAKLMGHRRPLEWSGDMKRMVTREARITSTSKGARVTMFGPRYLYAYRKDLNQPDKAAETTATTDREERTLAKQFDRRVTRRVNAVRDTERIAT